MYTIIVVDDEEELRNYLRCTELFIHQRQLTVHH